MTDESAAPLSRHDETSVTIREHDLATEVMGEMDFGTAAFLLAQGRRPNAGESRLFNAMLASLMVHGRTPHAIATRLTLRSEPASIQGAVASGLLGVGSQYAGAMQECATILQEVESNEDVGVTDVVARYRTAGDPFPGIGHRNFDPVDPRAKRLLELADDAEDAHLPGSHTDTLVAIQGAFEDELGIDLPINVTGAIAGLGSDMGLTPAGTRGIAVISRTAGLVAEVLDEQATPEAGAMYELIEREFDEQPSDE